MPLQNTIRSSGTLSGIGLHTGVQASVTLNPAPENYGIRFIRTDLANQPEILADIDNVVDNALCTTIGVGDVRVNTIEHLMAALAAWKIDNCRIEVTAEEVPLMDGSARPFFNLIKELGREIQKEKREYIVIDSPMWLYKSNDVALSVFPAEELHITLMVDYKNKVVGAQHTTLFDLNDFEKEFAPARTFCFLSEIEQLREMGLIKGGTPDSAVVVQDIPITEERISYLTKLFNMEGRVFAGENGYLNNTELHYPNELCRHKAVDLLGDLYLLGKPLCGHILAARTGHAANIEMAKKIRAHFKKRKQYRAENDIKITHEDILKLLPHRYPFLLVDSVEYIEVGKRIMATKNVSFNDQFFQGHFPDNPIMPGVLQIEAMAQAGGIVGLYHRENSENYQTLFLGVQNARFRKTVHPGDKLRMEVEILEDRRNRVKFSGKCFVGDAVTCEAEFMAMLVKK